MDRGQVDVVQPDVGRVGGFTEALRVVQLARDRGKLVVPHCWKTGIGAAATAHLAAVSPNCRFIEFLPAAVADSQLRRKLVSDELKIDRGSWTCLSDQGWGSISILTPFRGLRLLQTERIHRDRCLKKYKSIRATQTGGRPLTRNPSGWRQLGISSSILTI